MSLNLYNSETKELTQIAGNGVGVAKFGSKQSGEIWGKTSSSPWKAPIGGIYVRRFGDKVSLNQRIIDKTDNINYTAYFDGNGSDQRTVLTIPIIQGHEYYDNSDSWGSHTDVFYPFLENVVQPIEGGEVFSSQEVCIGTIDVDGVEKKVYRKSFTKSMSANGTWQAEIGATLASVVNFYGTFKKDSANWSQHIPYYHTDGAGSYSIYCYVNENGNVQCTGSATTDAQYFKGKYLLHVEYTKVND